MNKMIEEYLGSEANDLLNYECTGIKKESLHLPGPDFIDRVLMSTDRPISVLRNLQSIFKN